MILPNKHVRTENALVGVGADILESLSNAKTVSVLFHDVQTRREGSEKTRIHFDWFLLALDFLFSVGAVRFEEGLIRAKNQ